ncbi:MAG: hypothetical protein KDK39_04615 [Leptospiraceae bacterium]|nr:hypothetical protein [Leptospiraceae bacterium]
MATVSDSRLFQGSFFRFRYLTNWQHEIIEDVACFFRADSGGVLQIAASRLAAGSLDLKAQIRAYLQRNQIDGHQAELFEYQTTRGIPAIACEYWHQDRFWLVQFLGSQDRLLIVLYNGDEVPESDLAREISTMLASIEFI